MSRAVQEGCIASCVRYFLLPDHTHTCRLLRSTPISVSVLCCMYSMSDAPVGMSWQLPDYSIFDLFMFPNYVFSTIEVVFN